MPRVNPGYRVDDRCAEALKVLAKRTGKSVNGYLEDLLFNHAKINLVIPADAKPLGEFRGGARPNSGTKKTIVQSKDDAGFEPAIGDLQSPALPLG